MLYSTEYQESPNGQHPSHNNHNRRYSSSAAEAAAERSEDLTAVNPPVGAAVGNAGVDDDDATTGRDNELLLLPPPPPLPTPVLPVAPADSREANAVMLLWGGLLRRVGSRSLLSPRCRLLFIAIPETVKYEDGVWESKKKTRRTEKATLRGISL